MGFCVFDERICLSFVEKVEGYAIVLVGMVVGVHVLVVDLDDSFYFTCYVLHLDYSRLTRNPVKTGPV